MNSNDAPTLFDLTFEQIEGIRAYIETMRAMDEIEALIAEAIRADDCHYWESHQLAANLRDKARALYGSIQAMREVQTPYGKGVDFTLTHHADRWMQIVQALSR